MPSLSAQPVAIPSVWRLAAPVLVEQVLTILVGQIDGLLTGHFLEQRHLAAMGMLQYLLWMLPTMFAAVGIGATAMTARFVGAGDWPAANRVVHQSLLIGGGLVAALALVLWFGSLPLVHLLQLQGESAELAVEFLHIVLWSLPFLMIEVVGVACLRGVGRMGSGLLVMTGVNVVNAVMAVVLMQGLWFFPKLGWQGLAIGTASGHVAGGLLVLVLLAVDRGRLKLSPRLFQPDRALIRRLLKVGVPGGLDQFAVLACHFGFVSLVNTLGELATAAHGVTLRIETLCYPPAVAFHCVAATLAGQHLGARNPERAYQSVRSAWLWGTGGMTAAGVAFFVFADGLPQLLVRADHADIAAAASPLLRIMAFSMPAFATLTIVNGGLRGAGDTRWPLLVNFIGLLGVRIPLAWLLTQQFTLGVTGAWIAIVIDLMLRGGLAWYRFRQGGWMQAKV